MAAKLKSCCDDLCAWNCSEFGQVQVSIDNKKAELALLLNLCVSIDNRVQISACMDSISELEKSEKIL